jgi:hypothetical protein
VSQSQTELSVQDRCCISLETSAVYTSTNLRLPKPLRWLWLCGSPAAGGSWRRGASTSTWSDRCRCFRIVHRKNGTLNRTKQEAKEGRSRRGRRRKGEVGRESERPIPKSYPLWFSSTEPDCRASYSLLFLSLSWTWPMDHASSSAGKKVLS